MIFYKHQLVEIASRQEPAIYLGKFEGRHWFALYNYQGQFVPDWYSQATGLNYYKSDTKLPTPSGKKIYFGQLKENVINPDFNKEDYPAERLEELRAFIDAFKLKLAQAKEK